MFGNNNISEVKAADLKLYEDLINNRGYMGNDNVLDTKYDKHIMPNRTPGDIDPKSEPYIYDFLKLTQKYNIKVMLVQLYCLNNKFMQYTDVPTLYKTILENYNNVYMAKNGYKLKFYDNSMFCDPTHLNNKGAKLFTKQIADEFNEVFNDVR